MKPNKLLIYSVGLDDWSTGRGVAVKRHWDTKIANKRQKLKPES